MKALVQIGQVWRRRRDGRCMPIVQVHRVDRLVEVDDGGRRAIVPLNELRDKWEIVA